MMLTQNPFLSEPHPFQQPDGWGVEGSGLRIELIQSKFQQEHGAKGGERLPHEALPSPRRSEKISHLGAAVAGVVVRGGEFAHGAERSLQVDPANQRCRILQRRLIPYPQLVGPAQMHRPTGQAFKSFLVLQMTQAKQRFNRQGIQSDTPRLPGQQRPGVREAVHQSSLLWA